MDGNEMAQHSKRKKNINAKGRSLYDSSQYLLLTYKLIASPQFRGLGGNDVRVMMEIVTRHNGFNNGRIGVGLKQLSDSLNIGKSTAQRSLNNLQKSGFLKLRKLGRFQGRVASEWELTFLEAEGRPPSNEWGQTKALPYKRKRRTKSPIEEIHEEVQKQKIEKLDDGT